MAGSYNLCVDKKTGKLLNSEEFSKMVENLGGAYEAVEEMYGMIWFLAANFVNNSDEIPLMIERAREQYKMGLNMSPGTDGVVTDD